MDDGEFSHTLSEDGIADTSVKKRPRKKHLYSQILNQMEFYFSDANLSRDRFLSQLLHVDKNVPLDTFLRFNRIRSLTSDISDIVKALGKSQLLKVSDDGKCVYRTTEVQKKMNQDDCIIYVEQLPPDADHDWVSGIFSAYGKVEYVSIPRYKTRAAIKGFAFVEFDTPDAAQKALEAFGSVGSCLPPQMPPGELCSVATYEEGPTIKSEFDQEEDTLQKEKISEEKEEMKGKNKPDSPEEIDSQQELEEESEKEFSEPKSKKLKLEEHLPEDKPKKKTKKDKHHVEDINEIETDEVSVKKSRKRKIEEQEDGADAEDDKSGTTCQETDDSPKKKKKKKKKKHEDDSAENSLLDLEPEKKKKRELDSEGEDDDGSHKIELELEDSKAISDPHEKKKKKKQKKKREEDDSNSEDTDVDEGTTERKKTDADEEEEETAGDGSTKKKRSRKRNKAKKKKEGDHTHGLRIISKNEWRRLRNKYLNLQHEKMHALKKHLARGKFGGMYQSPYPSVESGQDERRENVLHARGYYTSQQEVKADETKKKKVSYTPGVIIQINLQELLKDVNKFKNNAKSQPGVVYVDADEGDSIVYIRCETADEAQKLVAEEVWEDMNILEGEAETSYWQKIIEDRNNKVTNKKRINVRGKDKLLKRAERELGKHIKFDD